MPPTTPKSSRLLIIHHRNNGMPVKDIANMLQISRQTVYNILKQHEERGSVSPKKIPGHPRLTTSNEDAEIIRQSRENPFRSAKSLLSGMGLPVSKRTVQRRLSDNNLPGRRAASKQILSSSNAMDRIGFAYQHQHWGRTEWSEVVFSDEKSFSVDDSGDIWVHRPRGKRFDEQYVHRQRRSGRFSVSVWGWMSAAGPGEFIRIDGNLTATQYIDILENACIPSVKALFGNNIRFVHDRSPIHMVTLTKNWMANQTVLQEMNWPARGADMNPIENLWATIARNSSAYPAANPDQLWENIYKCWNDIRLTNECETLINSMQNRLNSVIEHGGFWTKY